MVADYEIVEEIPTKLDYEFWCNIYTFGSRKEINFWIECDKVSPHINNLTTMSMDNHDLFKKAMVRDDIIMYFAKDIIGDLEEFLLDEENEDVINIVREQISLIKNHKNYNYFNIE